MSPQLRSWFESSTALVKSLELHRDAVTKLQEPLNRLRTMIFDRIDVARTNPHSRQIIEVDPKAHHSVKLGEAREALVVLYSLSENAEVLFRDLHDRVNRALLDWEQGASPALRAALANIVWSPEGVEVCEIFSTDYMPSCYSALTSIRRGCYIPLSYTPGPENRIDAPTLRRLAIIAGRIPDELA